MFVRILVHFSSSAEGLYIKKESIQITRALMPIFKKDGSDLPEARGLVYLKG
jgi:hypothetical protein